MSRSIQAPADNSSAPTFVQAPTATGITAGDYVYKNGGTYNSVADNTLASGAFPVLATNQSTYAYMSGGNSTTNNTRGSSRTRQSSAVLQNGNVVTVYANAFTGTFYPVFKIDTQAGVSVVAETNITSTYPLGATNNNIGVIVLANGNFVVFWENASSGYPYITYAIRTQTGTNVLSATPDVSSGYPITTPYGYLEGAALSGGGFVLAYNSSLLVYRIYTSAGAGAYTATLTPAIANANIILGIAPRSDGSFCIAWQDGTTTVRYQVVSATNTIIVDSTFAVTASSASYPVSVTCLSNDTFVIAYLSGWTPSSPKFRLLPTGNTLGAETAVPFPIAAYPASGSSAYCISVKSLASGNFVYAFWDNLQIINYNFYANTGASLSATLQITGSFSSTTAATNMYAPICLTEFTSTMAVFAVQGVSSVAGYQLYGMSAFQINKTTYLPTQTNVLASGTAGGVTAALNGYARSASTPETAAFFAAASQTATLSGSATSGAITQIQMTTFQVQNIALCALANGTGFAALVSPNSAASVSDYVQIYDANMVLQRTITLAAQQHNQNYYQNFKIALLSSGNLAVVIGYPAANNFVAYVVSPTLGTVLAGPSPNINTPNTYSSGVNYFYSICGIGLDRFVITYYANSYGSTYSTIYSYSGGTITQNNQFTSNPGNTYGALNAACLTGDGFYTGGYTSSYGYPYMTYWRESSLGSNSWNATVNNTTTFSSGYGTQFSSGINMVVNSNNIPYHPASSSTYIFSAATLTQMSNQGIVNNFPYGLYNTQNFTYANAVSASGYFVTFAAQSTSGYLIVSTPGGTFSYTSISGFNTNTNALASICSLFGPYMVVAWRDATDGTAYMAKVAVSPYSFSTSIVAGVTPSATTVTLTPTTGYTLSGVSVNSATAGNVAQMQVNGVARLSLAYNASQATQYFDTTGLINRGARGSVTGLNVILEGNV